MRRYTSIGDDNNGGALDAFKHAFWMARLTQGIGHRASLSLGKAHEKGNYKAFLNQSRQLESTTNFANDFFFFKCVVHTLGFLRDCFEQLTDFIDGLLDRRVVNNVFVVC